MKTILDDLRSCVLESISRGEDGQLHAIVAELQVGEPEEPDTSPDDDDNFPPAERVTNPTWVDAESRRVEVRFSGVIALACYR